MAVGDVRITSPWQEVTPPPREQVAVRQPSRVPVASLPATFTHRVTGMDGGAFYGSDGTGLMRVRLRYNQRDLSGQLKFCFDPPEPVMPQVMVPELRLIARSGRNPAGHYI
ncbi:hypothetical protein OHA79_45750 (plasmid) [Streptomyces sp. NBC_00841]|uniref:hypothetical protein n=1 Tax=Streptomyces sp. NBC_00841 TaxID=2975847 RepID=UPI002DDAE4FF|nr:hypothetical protein [Streptomyces sp. NBC_00841]WSA04943.1 hypothetical protein OHA79_45750 [Streptomyces sp. NBC_00841]